MLHVAAPDPKLSDAANRHRANLQGQAKMPPQVAAAHIERGAANDPSARPELERAAARHIRRVPARLELVGLGLVSIKPIASARTGARTRGAGRPAAPRASASSNRDGPSDPDEPEPGPEPGVAPINLAAPWRSPRLGAMNSALRDLLRQLGEMS
jgi:hypothetical protein